MQSVEKQFDYDNCNTVEIFIHVLYIACKVLTNEDKYHIKPDFAV